MPTKIVLLNDVGEVRLFKNARSRSIKITIGNDFTRVSLPRWLSYNAGLRFVNSKKDWILSHQRQNEVLTSGLLVGKSHRLQFITKSGCKKPIARITRTSIKVTHSQETEYTHPLVQIAARQAAVRALRQEAATLLPDRIKQLADQHDFKYSAVNVRALKSRWGSCSHDKRVILNIYLMILPWALIDYVILHELAHTKYLNHSSDFWEHMQSCVPDYKKLRKQLKQIHPNI